MFKIIQRYLLSTFIAPFLLSIVFFVSFLLTFQLFRIMDIMTSSSVEILTLLSLIWNLGISFLPMAVPLSALFAMLFSMNKLSEDSEIIAMRSFGYSKHKLFYPFLLAGLFIAWAIFSLNKNIIPIAYKQFSNTVVKLSSRGTITNIKAEQFFTDIPGITLFANKVTNSGEKMGQVFIHLKTENQKNEHIIFAEKGNLFRDGADEWGLPRLRLRLTDGNITKITDEKGDLEKILFKEYDFPLFNRDSAPAFVKKDSMKTNSELWEQIKESKSDHKEKQNLKTELEYWGRINTPLLSFIFILLGFPLGIKRARGRNSNASALVFVILLIYYSLYFFGVSLSKKGTISPFIATFLPTVLVLLVASYFYKKLDWTG